VTARTDTIVFERNFRIWKLDVASGNAAEVTITRVGAPAGPAVDHVRATSQFSHLALSPDGKKIAFAARGEIFAASAKDGGDAVRVTNTPAAEMDATWSPDSRKLVYASERDGDARLYMYEFANGKETQLTQASGVGLQASGDRAPRFAPDGKSVTFVRGGRELHVLDLESKRDRLLAKELIADEVDIGHPVAWSPDSKWIAFFTIGLRGFTNVSVVQASGGEATPVSFLANGNATSVA
jgi:Tol biopolymer transport system component